MSPLRAVVQRIRELLWPSRHRATPVVAVVLGIGNPGVEYAETRHNVGWIVVDRIVAQLRDVEKGHRCQAEVATGTLPGGGRIALAKPSTFVNRSGRAAKALLDHFDMDVSQCLVVVDDFNLALGRLRFRRQGSDGGHNGLRSIISSIGKGFPRLRVGIGPVPGGMSTIDFVLGSFVPEEKENKEEAIGRAAEAVGFYCTRGIDAAMSTYNS